ncbi:MAG: hypothetical protein ABUS48_04480 [Pseudomonadota bacterium]
MFRPGGVLWLLRHELRLSWRGWASAARKRGMVGQIILYVVIAIALLAGGWGIAWLLGEVPPSLSPEAIGITTAVFALIFTFMLSQALALTTESLYQRDDLDLLLGAPLPVWRVLIVRMFAIALNVATLYLLLTGAVFVFLPFTHGWRWMGMAPTVLAMALFATAIGLVVARVLFMLIGPRATRTVAQILSAFIGVSFAITMQAQNCGPAQQRGQAFMQLVDTLAHTIGSNSVLGLPARAALGDPIALATWLVAAFVIYCVSVWWFARRFVANAAAIQGMGARKRVDQRVRKTRGGLNVVLVRKEWRLLVRDPLLMFQILVQVVYFPVILAFAFRGLDFGGDAGRGQIAIFSGAFVLLASTLSSSLTWLAVSAEDAPDLIAAAPVPREHIERAKIIAAAIPVLVLMVIPAAGAAYFAPMAGLWLFAGVACAVISSGLIGVWYQNPGSRKNFRRRPGMSITARIGQTFTTLCWVGATGAAVAGWAIISIVPAIIALGVLLALHESRPKPELMAA